jgi:putative oxidoreductase
MNVINMAANGIGNMDMALAAAHMSMGVFFAISGGNKLFVAGRHATLKAELVKDKIPAINFMEWWVPGWEFAGGLMLLAGVFSAFAAAVLAIICGVAICCNAKKIVEGYAPINEPDRIADYLYLPEVLYVVLLMIPMFCGAGKFSMDYLMFN